MVRQLLERCPGNICSLFDHYYADLHLLKTTVGGPLMVRLVLVSFTLLLAGCGESAISPPSDAQPESLRRMVNQHLLFASGWPATSPGEPDGPHISTEWQIWAYSTASPSPISGDAAVVDGANSVLREGTNAAGNGHPAWTCLPANPRGMSDPGSGWNDAQEAMPLCADEEGMKWVAAYLAGERPQLERDAIIWMLHGDMGEDNTTPLVMSQGEAADPSQWIVSGPHLMLMPKDPGSLDAFGTDFTAGDPYTMFMGTDYAHLMIPMEDYNSGPNGAPMTLGYDGKYRYQGRN